ncbi:hypothetical protein ES703_103247 [subsurface metagenome]
MSITGTVPSPVTIPTESTRFVDLAGSVVAAGDWLTVLQESETGELEQFHIRSPNTDFRVSMNVDGASVFSKTYDEIRMISQNSPEIAAFAELNEDGDATGYYVVSLRNIPYESSILVRMQNTGLVPVTFSQLFAKYTIKE